ncbi:MAG: M48 family metalloprotease [Leptospirillia bacterium]
MAPIISRIRHAGLGNLLLLGTALLVGCASGAQTASGDPSDTLPERGMEAVTLPPNTSAEHAIQQLGGIYTADPALSSYVTSVAVRLAAAGPSGGLSPTPRVALINSPIPDARRLGEHQLAISRGLLTELESEAELAAVIAHLMAHDTKNQSAADGTPDDAAEQRADRQAIDRVAAAGYDPHLAAHLVQTFHQLAMRQAPDWMSGLFYHHPPSAARVRAGLRHVARYPTETGESGIYRHAERIRALLVNTDAYEAITRGHAALNRGDTALALTLAGDAAGHLPGAPDAHALSGAAHLAAGHPAEAENALSQALKLDDGYYKYYLVRGVARARQRKVEGALDDLNHSLAILPTAAAHLEMGRIYEGGDNEAARTHYRAAVALGGAAGKTARAALARLDKPEPPPAP